MARSVESISNRVAFVNTRSPVRPRSHQSGMERFTTILDSSVEALFDRGFDLFTRIDRLQLNGDIPNCDVKQPLTFPETSLRYSPRAGPITLSLRSLEKCILAPKNLGATST